MRQIHSALDPGDIPHDLVVLTCDRLACQGRDLVTGHIEDRDRGCAVDVGEVSDACLRSVDRVRPIIDPVRRQDARRHRCRRCGGESSVSRPGRTAESSRPGCRGSVPTCLEVVCPNASAGVSQEDRRAGTLRDLDLADRSRSRGGIGHLKARRIPCAR